MPTMSIIVQYSKSKDKNYTSIGMKVLIKLIAITK